MAQLDAQPEAVRQVAVADRIVLSKTDLADPAALRERLHRLNPGAPLLIAVHGAIDPAAMLHAGLFDPDSKIPDVRRLAGCRGLRGRASRTTITIRTGTTLASPHSA